MPDANPQDLVQAPQTDVINNPEQPEEAMDDASVAKRSFVSQKISQIRSSKRKFDKDFKRMRDNMDFHANLQWPEQKTILASPSLDGEYAYICNITQYLCAQKLSQLYAKNPKIAATQRKRLDYTIWSQDPQEIQQALGQTQQATQAGQPPNPDQAALIQDWAQGTFQRERVQRIGNTLEVIQQWNIDQQEPDFKRQMKNHVLTTIIAGVSYMTIGFEREYQAPLEQGPVDSNIATQLQTVKTTMDQLQKLGTPRANAQFERLRLYALSIENAISNNELDTVTEKLHYGFPSPLAVIVDEKCTNLDGFVGAHWIAEEFMKTLDEINSFFGLNIAQESLSANFNEAGDETNITTPPVTPPAGATDDPPKSLCQIWRVVDRDTNTEYYLMNGYKEYLKEPTPLPDTRNRWGIFPLIFNRKVTDPRCRSTIYPVSDVDLVFHIQREWNKAREAWRNHRFANRPIYVTTEGIWTDIDKTNLSSYNAHDLIILKGIPAGQGIDVRKLIVPLEKTPLDPLLYDNTPLIQDIAAVLGMSNMQAPMPAPGGDMSPKNVTATAANIQAQGASAGISSNADDLDMHLSEASLYAGQILVEELSPVTVFKVAGPGGVWPQTPGDRENYNQELYMTVSAGSSGKPNRAVDLQNWAQVAPILQQAGANPQSLIKHTINLVDDQLDPSEFFPVAPPQPLDTVGSQVQAPGGAMPAAPGQIPQPSQAQIPQPNGTDAARK